MLKSRPEDFVGKRIKYGNNQEGIISDIKAAVGYPEHFEPYYQVYVYDSNGNHKWYVNLPESQFYDRNPIFLPNLVEEES
jgi:hypothetical protein